MATQSDLSLVYSPDVAVPAQAVADDPATAYDYTAKGNLVAAISNGTAILGIGNLGSPRLQAGDGRRGSAGQAFRQRRFDRHRIGKRGQAKPVPAADRLQSCSFPSDNESSACFAFMERYLRDRRLDTVMGRRLWRDAIFRGSKTSEKVAALPWERGRESLLECGCGATVHVGNSKT